MTARQSMYKAGRGSWLCADRAPRSGARTSLPGRELNFDGGMPGPSTAFGTSVERKVRWQIFSVNDLRDRISEPDSAGRRAAIERWRHVAGGGKGGAGGLVTKTISVRPAEVPRPCMAEIRGGFLNTELWSELPKEQWIETEYKLARATGLAGDRGPGIYGRADSRAGPAGEAVMPMRLSFPRIMWATTFRRSSTRSSAAKKRWMSRCS